MSNFSKLAKSCYRQKNYGFFIHITGSNFKEVLKERLIKHHTKDFESWTENEDGEKIQVAIRNGDNVEEITFKELFDRLIV